MTNDPQYEIDGIPADIDRTESDVAPLQPGASISLAFLTQPHHTNHIQRYEDIRDIGASAPQNALVEVSDVTHRPSFTEQLRPGAPRDEVVVKVESLDADAIMDDVWIYITGYNDLSTDTGRTNTSRRVDLEAVVIDRVRDGIQTKSELEAEYSEGL